jgi:hypothetical protein
MTSPASTFPALTTPVFDGDTKLFGYTWQQQLIEWKRQIGLQSSFTGIAGRPRSPAAALMAA